jgi:hypothetical protein
LEGEPNALPHDVLGKFDGEQWIADLA